MEDDDEQIHRQLDKVAELATRKGSVVAIGHMRARTLNILKTVVPELESRGIRFVYASSLLR